MLNVGMKMRQFVNVVTENYNGGSYSLRRIKASDLFYGSTEEALLKEAEQGKKSNADPCVNMIRPRLPRTRIKFIQSHPVDNRINFLPLYGRRDSTNESKIFCMDAAGQSVLYDADSATVETLPHLHEPKGSSPVALSVTGPDDHDPTWLHALYVMDSIYGSFEALVYGDPSPDLIRIGGSTRMFVWHRKKLPPPPYAPHDSIQSYALLDSSTICISSGTKNVGTYCFNTARQEWTKAGCWTLPFYGRAQVVHELNNLCFGVADSMPHHFCALDLSSMDGSPPRLQHHWLDMDTPEGWSPTNASMAYMGAGKFCIAKTFDIVDKDTGDLVDTTTVLNGVEVVHKNGRTSKLRMIRHKSNRYSLVSHGIQCVLWIIASMLPVIGV